MKTGITKLNQLQVVVALLAFGLLAGASRSAAAAVRIEGQVQGERLSARKFRGHALAGKRPRMTPSKALHISRFRLHALQKAKRVERANGDQFEAHHMCFTQRQLFEHFVSDGRIGDVDDERHARLSL
jgi:hypothetical protein